MDALTFLGGVPDSSIPAAFLDPQYRGVLDKMKYGNEGKTRGKARVMLPQMKEGDITAIVGEISRVLIPSGHLFLWMDKFHLCEGFHDWRLGTSLQCVDLVVWNKERLAMGYRTRRTAEYLVILQKTPRRAKGVWTVHNIPDVWSESIPRNENTTHRKPVDLQGELITAVTNASDIVLDPAAGSFSVMDAALRRGRNFLGADIRG
ncbi:MAG: DNA methyltransferase [Chloroflexi bacterium]|nr:DNA methyltransferase [Chloroflexota bacterium]